MQRGASATLAGVILTPPFSADSLRSKGPLGDAALNTTLKHSNGMQTEVGMF